MEWFVKAFLKASLAWLSLGVTLGVAMAAHPIWTLYRLAHVHMVLLGFVTMLIYGVGYHVIPRFTGSPLFSRRDQGWTSRTMRHQERPRRRSGSGRGAGDRPCPRFPRCRSGWPGRNPGQ